MTTINRTHHDLSALARGTYQKGLINGDNRWSRSDLKGKAKRYSSAYHNSAQTLLKRIQALDGVKATFEVHDRIKVLVVDYL